MLLQLYHATSDVDLAALRFVRVFVLAADAENQVHMQGDRDIPDGFYTRNVVWKEALI